MGTTKTVQLVEVAYMIPAGREMRLTPRRKVVRQSGLERAVDKLVEAGAMNFAYCLVRVSR